MDTKGNLVLFLRKTDTGLTPCTENIEGGCTSELIIYWAKLLSKLLSGTFREYPGTSSLEKKSKIYFLIYDDFIHGGLFMTSHESETTPVRLPLCHMT